MTDESGANDRFAWAQERVRQLARSPASHELLELYGLYKQATHGDAEAERPGLLDFKGRAKHDAWAARRGMSRERARQEYVSLVERLVEAYG